ncbi:Methyl-accepting chemotaxis protein McpA [Sulfitobacter noctilucae]|uniref:methyl-accepting chemotaxis protein n=1 Tax=Sulfitobacter noctilucae TaxID=1342302 RepID=UPI00046ACB8B|nr:methyl-accepting chemotaxis protein [Sulfitobacter noctilucae]KIN60360.1 Methyl-accepting chemotaxis protein McpA [Sulfitobacter noctilucae]
MHSDTAQTRRVHPLQSLFFKCMLMTVVCVITVVAVIEYQSLSAATKAAEKAIKLRGAEVTELLAMQMGGSIKFANIEAIDRTVTDVIDAAGEDAKGAMVFDSEGRILFETSVRLPEETRADIRALIQQSLDAGEPVVSADGMISADVSRYGATATTVGGVVTVWTPEYAVATAFQSHMQTLLLGLGVLVLGLISSGIYLRMRMSQPLVQLEGAMTSVAEGKFDIDIPHINRRDEVGQMAQRLHEFRLSLDAAQTAQIEAGFKGAAFEGSSAAMMMVNEGLEIIFANPSCQKLIADLGPDLKNVWPGVTADTLTGRNLGAISRLKAVFETAGQGKQASDAGPVYPPVALRVGSRMIRIKISPAYNQSGALFGYVIEWADRTKSEKDAAVIGAMNTAQASIEFGKDGKVTAANQNFLDMINGRFEDTAVCSLSRMFANNLDNDPQGHEFATQVLAEEMREGRFSAYSVHADRTFVLQGSFAVTKDEDGAPDRVVFIGTNITDQAEAAQAAEMVRQRSAEEQDRVVEVLGAALRKLADGDLRTDITDDLPHDYIRLRTDFNETVGSLRDAISAVIHNSDSIRNETTEITSAADDLSRRTEKQAATLEETAAALDELTASVRSAAEGADDASKMSEEAQNNAQQGGEVARKAVSAMDGIKTSSQEISKITSVIDDIAFQTNLLALNAGVEAARAGEAGRGFAVVATEVRALAQRSSDAAREINQLINSSGEQVQQGVDLVDRTGAALDAIVTSVAEISKRVGNIAASAREQSSGLAEINAAVNELDHVTQQNAAMFEETTAASHALTSEADSLVNAVSRFKLDGVQITQRAAAPRPVPQPRPATPQSVGNAALKVQEDLDSWEEF